MEKRDLATFGFFKRRRRMFEGTATLGHITKAEVDVPQD